MISRVKNMLRMSQECETDLTSESLMLTTLLQRKETLQVYMSVNPSLSQPGFFVL